MSRASVLDTASLPSVHEPVLVAVSGGLDSTVLMHAMVEAGYAVVAGHVHHGMRPCADTDQETAALSAESLGIELLAHRLELDVPEGGSVQEAARTARYQALASMARSRSINTVAVAHHADDQAETLVLNLGRGAGPGGLSGMRAKATVPGAPDLTLARPLLRATKAMLRAWAVARGLSWREDPTNTDEKYRRNAVRARVIPALQEVFGPGIGATIARSANILAGYQDAEVGAVARLLFRALQLPLPASHVRARGGLLGNELVDLPDVWRKRILLDALQTWIPTAPRSRDSATALADLLGSQTGRRLRAGTGTVWRERDGLAFVAEIEPPDTTVIEVSSTELTFGALRITAERAAGPVLGSADRVSAPLSRRLVLRPWKAGDRILLSAGRRKVKEVLTDSRVPCYSRDSAPVVAAGDEVFWVVGLRAFHGVDGIGDHKEWVRLTLKPD